MMDPAGQDEQNKTTMNDNNKNKQPVKIYIARHGQDEDNALGVLNGHRDKPLTNIGKEQAKNLADKIKSIDGLNFNCVYSSPLQRAKYTAQIIIDTLLQHDKNNNRNSSSVLQKEKAPIVLDELIERNFGVMTGTPTKEITIRCKQTDILQTEKISYFLSPDGAETFPDLIVRAKKLLNKIESMHQSDDGSSSSPSNTSSSSSDNNNNILLVTHGDFGKMIYAAYYDIPWEDVLRQFHFGNSELLLLSKDSPSDHAHVFEFVQHNP